MLDERATRSPRSVQMMQMKKKIYNNYSKTRMKCIYKETIATIRYRSRFFASSIHLIFFFKNIFVYLCIYVSVCLTVCEIECEHAQAVLFLCFFFIIVFMIVSDLVNDYVPFYLPGDRCCLPLFHRYNYICKGMIICIRVDVSLFFLFEMVVTTIIIIIIITQPHTERPKNAAKEKNQKKQTNKRNGNTGDC